MKRKMQPKKGAEKKEPSMASMFGKTPKKTEPDDAPPRAPRARTKSALRRRLEGHSL